MTNRDAPVGPAKKEFLVLPHARVGEISGLPEIVHERGGKEDLPQLAEGLRLEPNDLLPTTDAANLLGFATVGQGDVIITETGDDFATADVQRSSQIFRAQLLKSVPFVSTVIQAIDEKRDGRIRKEYFLDMLEEHFTSSEAKEQFETLLDWAVMPSCSNMMQMKKGLFGWGQKVRSPDR